MGRQLMGERWCGVKALGVQDNISRTPPECFECPEFARSQHTNTPPTDASVFLPCAHCAPLSHPAPHTSTHATGADDDKAAGTKLQTVLASANADAAATIITSAGRNPATTAQAAATSIVDVFASSKQGGKSADAVADAFAFSAARDATATAVVLAKAAAGARTRGYTEVFGKQCVSSAVGFQGSCADVSMGVA